MPSASQKFLRPIDDVVETLRNAKDRGTKCSVLIGAGCSVTADIPTAQGFVEIIHKKYPTKYGRANPKSYPSCMCELSISEQRALIAEYVDKSKINWGHVALAQLIKEGYVDRVLTTNFDSLVVRACALLGIFPAVYDFASSQNFEADKIPGRAVFYLHGQRTGFVLMNEEKVLKKQSELLAPVFTDAGLGRVWMVVGYSGENDPVFNHLAEVKRFDNNLYWIGYRDNEPAQHVLDCLLSEEIDKDAYYVKGFDSDSFFVTLAQKLGCFPPDFVSKPFSYLDGLFNQLTEYTLPKTDSPIDALKNARTYVQEAIESIEGASSDVLEASSNLLSGDFEKVVELQPQGTDILDPKLSDSLAWAYIGQGNEFHDLAITKTGTEAEDLFKQAAEKYEEALKIQPDKYEAHHNLGNTLNGWARLKTGAEADRLFEQASEKYEAALNLKPDDVDTYSNWGNNLDAWAWTKTGDEAHKLFKRAAEKYEMALKLNPEHPDSLNGWGVVLFHQALLAADQDADTLFELAEKKFRDALEFKPDKFESLDNLGGVLVARSRLKDREQAVKLLETAKSFLLKAEALSRGGGSYNLACISSLLGNEAECHQWLRNAVENGQVISRPEIERDKDFTNVRDNQWFKEFLETLK